MNAPLSIERHTNGHYCLSGELDRDTVPPFWKCRTNWLPEGKTVTLDLAALQRVDSAGMAMLLHLQQLLNENHQSLILRNVPEPLRMLLTLSNVESLFADVIESAQEE
ncbi:STAS domain-containing protein [Enterovibrio nigricans]|uniref:Phospholipid transport system transporter-binding protein n=1 Tax=Enterovibrio nigricans DSM 22720 TaxID=1121868 RepID=A0A1T4TX33_9GAMM|nr:STAS domain-containing protein [Enterovibrio nigricans]PKF51419.1 STAS domain-containing protein [Enterovibrio nigricans]SKA44851.1 phospholipid transport system transporter-binding protein [Enterovibrio nigricans DSM 22720]